MGAVSGQGTTFNLLNYTGELFNVTPKDTPFLSMIGGLTGGVSADAKDINWQTVDNAAAEQPAIVEGADPTYAERSRSEVHNVLQIFQYGVEVSYTKLGATKHISNTVAVLGNQPVQNELDFQLNLKLQRAARDVEYSFLQGTYQQAATNGTARKTRGMKNAITTNTVAAGGDITTDHVNALLKEMADSGAPFTNPVIFANSWNKQRLSEIYTYAPESRTVGGSNISTIMTDFAQLGIVYDRHVPTDEVYIIDVAYCKPHFLNVPGKGHFFMEPLAKTGAAEKWQLYGEIGLEYGPEQWHGSLTSTSTS